MNKIAAILLIALATVPSSYADDAMLTKGWAITVTWTEKNVVKKSNVCNAVLVPCFFETEEQCTKAFPRADFKTVQTYVIKRGADRAENGATLFMYTCTPPSISVRE